MVIPLMNFLRQVAIRPWVRRGLLVLMVFTAVAAVGTQSRGAFLAITAMGVVLWLRSHQKLAAALVVGGVAIGLIAFMPSAWEQRMNSIENYRDDGSAMARIEAWSMTFNLANRHIFGGGFEIYRPDVYAIFLSDAIYMRGAHSIYFSVLGEHGYVGLILFLTIWMLAFRIAGQIRREAQKQCDTLWLHDLAGMCQVSLVGYLVGGAFLALAYFDLPYNILIVLVVAQNWLRNKQWKTELPGACGSDALPANLPRPVRQRTL